MSTNRSYESVNFSPVPADAGKTSVVSPASLVSPSSPESTQSLQSPPSPRLPQSQGDASIQCHTFKSKLFGKKRACSVCHQIINTHGSSCRVCKYACHKSCEPKASSNCKEAVERLQNDPLAKPRQPPTKPLPQGRLVAGRRCREPPDLPASMELNFVTQRVMALCFPLGVDAATYRDNLREVAQMLHTKHGDNYMIFNLSERRSELSELNRQVSEYGFPETLAPRLDKLCSICKAIDSWTSADPHNVAVLHSCGSSGDSRGGWDRIGVVVSAYIHYSNICRSPDQALDRLTMKKFFDDKIRHLDHPSQKRYVNYFAGLLSGLIQINSAPLGLHHLVLVGAPQLRPSGGCRVFVRVYQGMLPIWTSGIYTVDDRAKYTVISPEMVLQLRGDILIKCYHCESPTERQVVFRVQFHTCAVSDAVLSFPRQDLDDACDDMRFPLDGGVELHFSATSLGQDQVAAPVRLDRTPDPVQRWDSYEDFRTAAADLPDAAEPPPHTEGPLDGSLYATVIKKPVSPRSAAAADSHELHTVSMDSGISSGGRERLSGGSSHSPSGPHSAGSARSAPCDSSPLAAADTSAATPAPRVPRATVEAPSRVKKQPSVDASQLDELLSGLLENCSNIPDLRPCQTPAPDLDTIQTPTFATAPTSVSAQRATSRGRTVSSRDADASVSSGYGSQQQSPPHPPPPTADMVHYNGYKSDSAFSESFSAKAEEEIPYHARSDSKPFSYASFSAASQRRSPSPASEPPRRSESASREAPRAALESPRLVRKLLVGGSSGGSGGSSSSNVPSQAAGRKAPPSPSLPRKSYTNGSSSRTTVTDTFSKTTNGSGSGGVGSRAPLKASDTLQSHRSFASDSAPSHRSYNTDTMKSYNTDTIKSYNTDTLRSNASFNTDTLKSNRSYDWENSIRSKTSPAPAPASAPAPAPASAQAPSPSPAPSRALEPFRRAPPSAQRDIDINLNDPNAKTVTTYDQNTNSMTTVSTQSFDVPCSPNPTRKIVETTKRYMVDDDEHGRQTGVTKMEETIREFVIEDLPDGPGSAGNVTWLQKQQQKLRDRQQARIRNDREPKEARVLHELRQRHGGVEDGYMSDTTLWTDTSRETSPAQMAPLHVNINGGKTGSSAPVSPQQAARSASRESSATGSYRYNQYGSVQRPLARHRSETAYDRERPHVQVLRSDQRKTSDSDLTHLTKTTQYSQCSSTPVRDREGLLTTVNGQSGVRDPSEPRPETPAFPNPPKTPYQNQSQTLPPKSPTSQRKLLTVTQTTKTFTRTPYQVPALGRERSPSPGVHQVHFETSAAFESSPSGPAGHSRHSSVSSDTEVISAHPTFVKDSSRWWYTPAITREQAISLLRDKAPGSFVIRDSNSFPGAFGLALKVESPPTSAPARGGDPGSELVRHFLIETTSKGVRLKGCPNEPTFGSLSALVYQHSITPLALPCKLALPETELALDDVVDSPPAAQQKHRVLLDTGAACSVLYLWSCDTEALTGPQAVRRATTELLKRQPLPEGVVVHFKVSQQGITLTDSLRKQFFRRHYNTNLVSHCSLDPEDRRWTQRGDDGQPVGSLRVFGFVAKKGPSNGNNQCHLFAEYDSDQPASAIVNFVTNVMLSSTYGARANML